MPSFLPDFLSKFSKTFSVPADSRSRIVQLDGLRGILALQVAFFHLASGLDLSKAAAETYAPLLMNHWISVDLFFAMSGFVMSYVYAIDFAGKVSGTAYSDFMVHRFARIMPLNIFALALMMTTLVPVVWGTERFLSLDGRYSWVSAILGIFLLQGPFMDHRTWNYPAWSVSVEWCLYFLFPFMLLAIRGRPVALLVTITTALFVTGYYLQLEPTTNGFSSLLRGALLFVTGIALFRLKDEAAAGHSLLFMITVPAAILLLCFGATQYYAALLTPLILISAIRNPIFANFLSGPILYFLGTISYSLYMLHAFVQIVIANRIHDLAAKFLGDSILLSFVCVGIGLALAIAFATLSVLYIEIPARHFIRNHVVRRVVTTG